MNDHTKMYSDFESFSKANEIMNEFQVLHNILRKDYIVLLNLTDQFKDKKIEFYSLYKSCLVRLFTMIEADIFGLGMLDPYPKTKTKDNFFDSFTKTFNQISVTWNKEVIKEKYFTTYFTELMSLKGERNNLIHPKKVEDIIIPTYQDFERIRLAFNNYNDFMNELMNQFFIGSNSVTETQMNEIIKKANERGITLSNFELRNTIITHI